VPVSRVNKCGNRRSPGYFPVPLSFFRRATDVSLSAKGSNVARKSPAEKLDFMRNVARAWEVLRPHRSFFGHTLARFKDALQPSLDARTEIADLQQRLRIAIKKRDAADRRSFRILRGVIFAVQGDSDEGGDGELYEAMGYVPWRFRGRPRRRKTRR
jgi:hypothetical protein